MRVLWNSVCSSEKWECSQLLCLFSQLVRRCNRKWMHACSAPGGKATQPHNCVDQSLCVSLGEWWYPHPPFAPLPDGEANAKARTRCLLFPSQGIRAEETATVDLQGTAAPLAPSNMPLSRSPAVGASPVGEQRGPACSPGVISTSWRASRSPACARSLSKATAPPRTPPLQCWHN